MVHLTRNDNTTVALSEIDLGARRTYKIELAKHNLQSFSLPPGFDIVICTMNLIGNLA